MQNVGHRVLIFTQMTKMLDTLEKFLNFNGHTYLRLDGSTKPETRQALMERFNADRRIFAFILSTRSGGFGINLTGADTVVFYDSDWNPAMDAQAQDRCHRIGQTREVHIYRLISEHTVEENILKKANQKRLLDKVTIDAGKFTTDFFQEIDLRSVIDERNAIGATNAAERRLTAEELEQAMANVEDESDVEGINETETKRERERERATFTDLLVYTAMKLAKAELQTQVEEFSEEAPTVAEEERAAQLSTEPSSLTEAASVFDEETLSQLRPVERYVVCSFASVCWQWH